MTPQVFSISRLQFKYLMDKSISLTKAIIKQG
jgi:hypothetical protein